MMGNLFDLLRSVLCAIDDFFVQSTGRIVFHYSRLSGRPSSDQVYTEDRLQSFSSTSTKLRGFYSIPLSSAITTFGIDTPDEMQLQLGFNSTVKKIGMIPQIGDLMVDHANGHWVITDRARKDDMFRGTNRLVLTLSRFQESATTEVNHHK